MNANPPSRSARPRNRVPGAGLVCAGLALQLSVALAGCDRVTPAPLAAPGYPSLHDVPPRPEPADTVRQREALAAGLIQDRADARYTNQAIRYRTGLADAPPLPVVVAPEPPPPVAVTPEAIPVRPPRPAALDVGESLGDFLRRLAERAEAVDPAEAPAAFPDEPLAPSPAEATGGAGPPDVDPPEPAAGPEAAAEPRPPLPLFPARAKAEGDPGAGLLAWVGRRLRALAGAADSPPSRPPHPALVPVAVTGPEDLWPAREPGAASPVTAPPAPAVPALKPAAPPVPALKPVTGPA